MHKKILFLLFLCLALLAWWRLPAPGARAEELSEQQEQEIMEKYKNGQLDRDRLVQMAKKLSFSEKLRLYLLSRELRPYFKPIELAIRDLARTPLEDQEALKQARQKVKETMQASYQCLMNSNRPQKEKDWQRGLLALIFLDKDWRKRNEKAGKNEVKNPFDLPKLFDQINQEIGAVPPQAQTSATP